MINVDIQELDLVAYIIEGNRNMNPRLASAAISALGVLTRDSELALQPEETLMILRTAGLFVRPNL